MVDKTWKVRERKIARFFGTERNPGSGSADPNHRSDSQHPTLFIETKYRAKHTALTLLRETRKIAEKENKTAVCCLAEKGKKGFGILIHSEDLDAFIKRFIEFSEFDSSNLNYPSEIL